MAAVTIINCFTIPAGQDDEFFVLWQEVNAYLRAKPGYLGHTLHRSLSPDAAFRFINIGHWASAEDFGAAHDDGFRALISQRDGRRSAPRPRCTRSCTKVRVPRGHV